MSSDQLYEGKKPRLVNVYSDRTNSCSGYKGFVIFFSIFFGHFSLRSSSCVHYLTHEGQTPHTRYTRTPTRKRSIYSTTCIVRTTSKTKNISKKSHKQVFYACDKHTNKKRIAYVKLVTRNVDLLESPASFLAYTQFKTKLLVVKCELRYNIQYASCVSLIIALSQYVCNYS